MSLEDVKKCSICHGELVIVSYLSKSDELCFFLACPKCDNIDVSEAIEPGDDES